MDTLQMIGEIADRDFRALTDAELEAIRSFLKDYGYSSDHEFPSWFRKMLRSILDSSCDFLRFDFDDMQDSNISSLMQELAARYGWIVDDYGEAIRVDFPKGKVSAFISREDAHPGGGSCNSYCITRIE